MKTLITYEEWWAYEGKRRRERPYSPQTSVSYAQRCQTHNKLFYHCLECKTKYPQGLFTFFEKTVLHREPYEDYPEHLAEMGAHEVMAVSR